MSQGIGPRIQTKKSLINRSHAFPLGTGPGLVKDRHRVWIEVFFAWVLWKVLEDVPPVCEDQQTTAHVTNPACCLLGFCTACELRMFLILTVLNSWNKSKEDKHFMTSESCVKFNLCPQTRFYENTATPLRLHVVCGCFRATGLSRRHWDHMALKA